MKIHSIELLSIEQLEKYKDFIPETSEKWWLRDAGQNEMFCAAATGKGEAIPNGVVVRGEYCGIRPVIRILSENPPMTPGCPVTFGGRGFTALSERYAIMNEPIEYSVYADGIYQNVFINGEYRGAPNNYSHSLPLKIAREWAKAHEVEMVSPWVSPKDPEPAVNGGILLREMATAPGCIDFLKINVNPTDKEAYYGRIINIERFADNPHMKEFVKTHYGSCRSASDFIRMAPIRAAMEMLDDYMFGVAQFSPTNYKGRGNYEVLGPMDYRVTDSQLRDFMKQLNIPEKFLPPEREAGSRTEEDKGLDEECL